MGLSSKTQGNSSAGGGTTCAGLVPLAVEVAHQPEGTLVGCRHRTMSQNRPLCDIEIEGKVGWKEEEEFLVHRAATSRILEKTYWGDNAKVDLKKIRKPRQNKSLVHKRGKTS